MSDNVLALRDIAVEYDGRTVLDVGHLEVRRGHILTLLGENGSGKTTLLRLLGLLIRPVRGRVIFCGEEVDFGNSRALLELRRRVAAVMQEPLLCRMSVRRNVALGLRFRGVSKPDASSRVSTWLEKLAISHLAERSAHKLSGGEAQRVSLARAMVLNPQVLFLDEPFAALDAPTRQGLLQDFKSVIAETGVTAVFATHDRGEALALGNHVAVLVHGHVAQAGPAEWVFSRPERVDVARFVGIESLFPGRVVGKANGLTHVECGEIEIESVSDCDVGEEVHVAVRPEDIDIVSVEGQATSEARNTIPGLVKKLVPAETHFRVELDCQLRMVAVLSRSRFRELKLQVGDRVQASFSPHAAHLIGHRYTDSRHG